jgi:hypothetical protein
VMARSQQYQQPPTPLPSNHPLPTPSSPLASKQPSYPVQEPPRAGPYHPPPEPANLQGQPASHAPAPAEQHAYYWPPAPSHQPGQYGGPVANGAGTHHRREAQPQQRPLVEESLIEL